MSLVNYTLPSSSLKMVERGLLLSSANSILKKGKPAGDETVEHEEADRVVAMARTRNGDFLPVTSKALHTAVKAGALPAEFECLQPFVQARDYDTTGEFANYQHQYTLDDTGGGVSTGTVHRRVAAGVSGKEAATSFPGRRRRTLILSRNARLNAEIGAAVRSVVLTIERSKHCRVLCIETEFVLDDQDGLWLAGVTACKVAARPSTASVLPAPPPARPDGVAAHEPAPNASGTTNGDVGLGGGALATEVRSRKREAEEAAGVVTDTEFSQLLRAVGYRSPIKKRSDGSDGSRRRHGRSSLRSYGSGAKNIRAPDGNPNRASPGGLAHPQTPLSGKCHQKMVVDQRSVDSAAFGTSFDRSFKEESYRRPAASINNLGDDLGVGGASGKPPSPTSRVSTEGFDSCATSVDHAATNRIHGTSQVRTGKGGKGGAGPSAVQRKLLTTWFIRASTPTLRHGPVETFTHLDTLRPQRVF